MRLKCPKLISVKGLHFFEKKLSELIALPEMVLQGGEQKSVGCTGSVWKIKNVVYATIHSAILQIANTPHYSDNL